MLNKIKSLSIVAFISIFTSSCAVMFGGSKYSATITAVDHPNADIYVNGSKSGKGTVTGLYDRDLPLMVEIREDGCENKTETYYKVFRSGAFALDFITVFGLLIDASAGALYKPDHVNNPAIQKISEKDFTFNIEFDECSN